MSESELRERLDRETLRALRLEGELESLRARFGIVERDMPVPLAFVDAEERYRFHNDAYRRWLNLSAEQIDGRIMREVLGETVYAAIADSVRQALSGACVRYDHSQACSSGTRQISTHLVPYFNELRAVAGFYFLQIDPQVMAGVGGAVADIPSLGAQSTVADIPSLGAQSAVADLPSLGAQSAVADIPSLGVGGAVADIPSLGMESAVADISSLIAPLSPADMAEDAPELLEGAVAKAQTAWRKAVEHIKSAIRNDEFRLYCREIKDLTADVPPFYGILVRQAEEEQNRMPPGAFFALAEEYGLVSELDRWVVCGVLGWAGARKLERASWRASMYCINLSRDTIGDPHFPEFVQAQLNKSGVPVEALCFVFQVTDVTALRVDSAELIRNLRSLGCRTMLGGFDGDRSSMEILKEMRFDFLLIDGSLVYNILRSEASLTKMRGIARLAHAVGIKTVAELVESTATVVKLRDLKIDYAQGEAIAAALPLHVLH